MSIYLDRVAEKAAVKALGDDIGFGRIIQLAHQCWDEMLEAKHGIKGHSEAYRRAASDSIREELYEALLLLTDCVEHAWPNLGGLGPVAAARAVLAKAAPADVPRSGITAHAPREDQ